MLWNFRLHKALLACFIYDTKQKSFSSGVLCCCSFYIVKEMLSTYTKVEETEYNLDDNKNVKKNLHIHS